MNKETTMKNLDEVKKELEVLEAKMAKKRAERRHYPATGKGSYKRTVAGNDLRELNREWEKQKGFLHNLTKNKETIMKTYKEKTEIITEAIQKGMKFYLDTYLGRLEVQGINSDGDWVRTGTGNRIRSWAICNIQIDGWYSEITTLVKSIKDRIK